MKAVYLDMDGTFVDLYADPNWLAKLRAYDASVYAKAKPKCNMSVLARTLNRLQKDGYTIGVISWLSKEPQPVFDKAVTDAKMKWLKTHLRSVQFDEIHIIAYGTPKSSVAKNQYGILIDDELRNRQEWANNGGCACDADYLIDMLLSL